VHHPGGWTAFRSASLAGTSAGKDKAVAQKVRTKNQRRKLTYNDQRELDQLSKAVPRLERRRNELADALDAAAGDYAHTVELSGKLATLITELDAAETRWLELSEEAERLADS
jgi:ABC transport system ATP-binding/permease protein